MSSAHVLPILERDPQPALHLVHARPSPIAPEVLRGLSANPKSLRPWLFYDAAGSSLFEQITQLSEYYLTRAERSIFTAHADEIIALARSRSSQPLHILELGAGSASKTGLILAAAVRAQGWVLYQPLDVSASALASASHHLESEVPGVEVDPHVVDYTRGYSQVTRPAGPRLALYIGSSIGNFEPPDALAVLRELRAQLVAGDTLLLGTDLRKDPATLLAAYNDALGVTAAFNKNVLTRINRELGANFRLDGFAHEARWNPRRSRMEMHLVSRHTQRVRIADLGVTVHFAASESIHTENSYKYTPRKVAKILRDAGFEPSVNWRDDEGLFQVTLATVASK